MLIFFQLSKSGSRPPPPQAQAPQQQSLQSQQGSQGPGTPQFNQHASYAPQFYPPQQGQWGRGGSFPGPGYPGMPYASPPAWYPPPGQGFSQPGPVPYGGFPVAPPNQQPTQPPKPAPIGPIQNKDQTPSVPAADKITEAKEQSLPSTQATGTTAGSSNAPAPLAATKLTSNELPAAPTLPSVPHAATAPATKPPTGPKNGRIVPAIPLQGSSATKAPLQTNTGNVVKEATPQTTAASSRPAVDDATRAATAAVAAAMAKLPPINGQHTNGNTKVDNLVAKVSEMRTSEPIRAPRHPGTGGSVGQRGRARGGPRQDTRKVGVPVTDFDFESANAKFNKQGLVKEAIAGSPVVENSSNGPNNTENEAIIPTGPSYNKASSFFDDLSSEIKDRESGDTRLGGRQRRGEEQKKNLETFGQGSVDNGYRGGYRGRGRGRAGMRSRQLGTRGRGGYRGNRGDPHALT